ncbi:MAG: hypothetical protein K6C10_01655 [Prevotella sp.]|nr:hypothetical protein [Prevotella sp.]
MFAFLTTTGFAQKEVLRATKKDISQARTYLKAGKNFDKAEKLMRDRLKDSINRDNQRIWLLLFESIKKQYDQGNEKLYLKQKYDTAALFTLTMKMFDVLEGLDTIDARPDVNGKIRPQYRKRHGEFLSNYRKNLYNGGLYYLSKQKYSEAYHFLDKYIACAHHPLYAPFRYAETDKLLPEASYWAAYCGYKNQDACATFHHTYLALKDTAHYCSMLQFLADTYNMESDTTRYVKTLREGFEKYPSEPFFFSRLYDFYSTQANWNEVLSLSEQALRNDSTDMTVKLVKSSALLNTSQYDECIAFADKIIATNNSLAEPFYNAGMSCFYQAVEFDKKLRKTKKQQQQITKLYQKSLAYMERYRALAPNESKRWALPLYTIYLNLNMGSEFDEINSIIKKSKP